MSTETQTIPGREVPIFSRFDRHTAIFAAIVLGFVGNAVFMGMPMLVGAIADSFRVDEQQLGWVVSADLGGVFLASMFTSLVITKVNRRHLAIAGLLIAVIANLASTYTTDLNMLIFVRIIAGIGGGICYSTGMTCLARTHHTARNFSILLFALVFINAVELYTFPSIANLWGVNGIFVFFAVSSALSLLVISWIPPFNEEEVDDTSTVEDNNPRSRGGFHIPSILPWCCLAAVFSFYILIGSFWAFIERAGVHAGMSENFITNALTWGTVFSLVGCVTAAWLAKRFGQSGPLLSALFLMTMLMLILAVKMEQNTYLLAIFGFNLFWIFTDIFQLGTLSKIDQTGRYVALVPGSQGIAQTIAPAVAGFILIHDFSYSAVMVMGAIGSGVAFAIYAYVYIRMEEMVPAVMGEN